MNMMGQRFQPAAGSFTSQQPRIERVYLPIYLVSNINAIQPGDVSGDGNPNFFVTKDLSCICVKMLNDQGLIDTGIYMLQRNEPVAQSNMMQMANVQNSGNNQNPGNNQNDVLQQILARMDEIESRLNKQSKPYKNKQNYQNKPKEGGSNNGK